MHVVESLEGDDSTQVEEDDSPVHSHQADTPHNCYVRACAQKGECVTLPPELESLCHDVKVPLSGAEMTQVRQMLDDNEGVFALEGEPLGQTGLVQHKIVVTSQAH